MIDISTVGAQIVIKFADNKQKTITQFSDEGTPFECPDVDVSTNAKNLNGQMISSRTPSIYPVSITVVPGSEEDMFLQRRLSGASIQPGNVKSIGELAVSSLTVSIPAINESGEGSHAIDYTFTNGRLKSGPMGPSTSAEGRMSARTYTFEFEKYNPPTHGGTDINPANKEININPGV